MPGICGFVGGEQAEDANGLLDSMLATLKHADWYTVERGEVREGLGLGRVSLGFVNRGPQPVSLGDTGGQAVMDGEIYDAPRHRRELESAGVQFDGDSQAELLLRGYLHEGQDCFRRLEGKYSAALWDGERRRLILVNDKFGMKPLYYAHTGGRLLFASEIKALLVDEQVSRAQNTRGIAQFFTFGHLWGEETFYDAIRALPAAAWIVYDMDRNELSVERYWRWQSPAVAGDSEIPATLERIDAAFQRAVELRLQDADGLGLSLSGGLDARTILGMIDQGQCSLTNVCIGMEGSLDHRAARRLSELAGQPYHGYVLNDRFLGAFQQHLARMVELTDGHYLSQCIVMPTLPYYRELGIKVLLRGHAGELMHMHKAYNFSLDSAALAIRDEAGLTDWLFRHLQAYMLEAVDGELFVDIGRGELETLARTTLRESLQETAGWDPPLHRIWQLFVYERSRRETAMSLVKFGSVVETRLPYIDEPLIAALLALPPQTKVSEAVQTHILRRHRPSFLKVPNANTGAPVGASALRRSASYFRMKVLAKLGVKGYQPYERLGLWLRRELEPVVREILLDERCLSRGVFQPDTVRTTVDQHNRQERNHTYLLMAMMIYELGQRRFVDGETPLSPALAEAADG